ncbi:MAG: LysR family transcriptional regulator [Proteobacteria bacterium]|nr:LysR family transcriptional regulator [Pseudomonadota bacterium]
MNSSSFTRAAPRLGVSKSVVSRRISRLEEELGVQLLYRSTHSLSLTEAGERLFAQCKDLDDIAEQAKATAAAIQQSPRGLLRITLPQSLAVSPLGKLVSLFQAAYPEMLIDARVTSLQVDLIEEGFDLALRTGALADSELVCRRICEVRMQAVATRAYLQRHGRPKTVNDLSKHNCLIYSEFAVRDGKSAVKLGAASDSPVVVGGNFSTNSGVLLLHSLLAGQGIAIGPDLMFEEHVSKQAVEVIFDNREATAVGLYAVFPPGRFASPGRTAFVKFLIDHLGRGGKSLVC